MYLKFVNEFQLLLKRVRLSELESGWQKDLSTWSQLRHRHILLYLDAWQTDDAQYVLSEAARASLSVVLRAMLPGRPTKELFDVWIYQITSALKVRKFKSISVKRNKSLSVCVSSSNVA